MYTQPERNPHLQPFIPGTSGAPPRASQNLFEDLSAVQQSQQQFFQGVGSMAANPLAQTAWNAALSSGASFIGQDKFRGWLSLDMLRYYFNVNNSYVANKLKVILCPPLHKTFRRNTIRTDAGGESYCPPRDDVNAPDLYIPLMSFITYILLTGFALGHGGQFSPDLLGATTSKGFIMLFLKILVIKGWFYFLDEVVPISLLDIISYCGYIFVLLNVNILSGLLFGSFIYYMVLLGTSFMMAHFIVKTLKLVVLPEQMNTVANSRGRKYGRKYFLLTIACLQFVVSYLLGYVS